ncbi:hypothetical protein SAMN05421810_102829 [Amycolatopsis arida]|uniref:Uncharacterized protein n=1 Tax=Amycolatopsis arida TaxID=587909 RepID=A0A1I5R119_9PSEU|nr:hypothetical protein [Amycolatopsis arida]TDX99029.1 hypothetical protein CLV69_101830 [Amycolatopsis arida]SFP52011.1 hypothetical protein SAMN05421810_102829 [Amycolatopsis arida]
MQTVEVPADEVGEVGEVGTPIFEAIRREFGLPANEPLTEDTPEEPPAGD